MSRKHPIAVGLDIGSARTRVVVLAVEGGIVRYVAHAGVPSRGWHRGQISDQMAVAASIREAISEAEHQCGMEIGSVVVGVGGPAVRSQQGRGLYDFGHRRPIGKEDLAYAVKQSTRAQLEPDRFLLQVAPQDFTVDGQPPMLHPLNIECLRLEAHSLLLTTSVQEHQALLSAVHQAHLRVEETIYEAMAAAYASILPDERAGGVALIDVGAHSTDAVYYDGDSMLFAIGMPISGDHFSKDIADVKSLSFDEAERMKIAHGCALLGLTSDNIIIELPAEGGRPAHEVSRRDLIEILEARAMQLFQLVERFRLQYARELPLREGVVLAGGAALLDGMVEVAEKVLGCPARLGFPRGIADWPDELGVVWTTAAGLAMYSGRLQIRKDKAGAGPNLWSLFSSRA